MTLRLLGHIELPAHRSSGGFDHADIHSPTDRIYVAHTANDSIDLIDCAQDRYVESIPGFVGVAGALVSKARGMVFATNRGENTVSVFTPGGERNQDRCRHQAEWRRIRLRARPSDRRQCRGSRHFGFLYRIGRGS